MTSTDGGRQLRLRRRVAAAAVVASFSAAMLLIATSQSPREQSVATVKAAESRIGAAATAGVLPSSASAPRPAAAPSTTAEPHASSSAALGYGVLGGSCDADRATALRAAGVRFVEFGVDWSQFEPSAGVFDAEYIGGLRDRIARCRAAGLSLVLTPGFQYAPSWVAKLPGGFYRNQHGGDGPADVPNLVFSSAVRSAAAAYLVRFAAEFPLDGFAAVRVGTSESGELGYPGRDFGAPNPGNDFWAFDAAASTGQGLPAGIDPDPLPGWTPGSPTWQGRAVTTAETRSWFSWYGGSVARTVVWTIGVLRSAGFHGPVHVPLAGRGLLPADLAAAAASHFDGSTERDGSLERGLYYPDQLATIAEAGRSAPGPVLADVTGLDDATAVAARALDPRQDVCLPSDATSALRSDPAVENWSASRWTIANARAAGLGAVGENPGSPSIPGTGGDGGSDDLAQQLVHAPDYARSCGLSLFMWAFEDDLFAPSPAVSVADLANRIAG